MFAYTVGKERNTLTDSPSVPPEVIQCSTGPLVLIQNLSVRKEARKRLQILSVQARIVVVARDASSPLMIGACISVSSDGVLRTRSYLPNVHSPFS